MPAALNPHILLTGIPRSGTSLVAHLLDSLNDMVCLNEPQRGYTLVSQARDAEEFVRMTVADLNTTYSTLARAGFVFDRREPDGSVPTNYYEPTGKRRDIPMRPVSRRNFALRGQLAMKHNEVFTSVLPLLCEIPEIRIIAVVRHPIPTILSWQSCEIALAMGRLSSGYRFWDEAQESSHSPPIMDMQARIYDLYCARYHLYRDRITLIRYEDLIQNSHVLEEITGRSLRAKPSLQSQNDKRCKNVHPARLAALKAAVKRHCAAAQILYSDLDCW